MKIKDKSVRKLLRRDPLLRFRYDDQLGVFRHLQGNLAVAPRKNVEELRSVGLRFLKDHSDLFGKIDLRRMSVLEDTRDPNGGRSLTLQQYRDKARVFGGSVRFHITRDGILDTISNRLFPDLADVPREPRVTAGQAIEIAQQGTKCKSAPEQKPELLVYRYERKLCLAWEVRLNDTKRGRSGFPSRWIAYVDAVSGKLFLHYDNVQTAGPVVGNGTGVYSGSGLLNAWFNDVAYQLRDKTRTATGGPEIVTNDEDGASPSEDADNDWNDMSTLPRHLSQGAEVDAHRYASAVTEYFMTTHGRNSFDGAGGDFIVLVHYGTNFNNGGWDGARVCLGDGDGLSWDYLCSDDWLAHEFTHAYTQHTCALQYWSESGALNEALSDVFAAFITGDWLVFEDTWLQASAPAARNMMDPTNNGQWDNSSEADAQASVLAGHQPSHYNSRYTGTWDNAGVHVNSGIINHLFYLLTVGGTHAISGISVTGIGQSAAEQMLFRCMTVNLVGNPTATFLDFREAMLDACLELFPKDLVKLTQVKNAFNAVGIGPDIYVRDNVADNGQEPYPGTYLYASPDIINRNTPSTNPTADFVDLTNEALWQNVTFGQDNYIYVRLQNRGNHNGDATINLYFSSASTFPTPVAWIPIGTLSESAITPGSLRIAGPLVFPSAMIPAPGHYCMIALVSSSLDPSPNHTLITSVSDYLNFVRNTNNIAYRNMDVVEIAPGASGAIEANVQSLFNVLERFDLRIDFSRFVPGAKIRVHGPAHALDGAITRGLRLIARKKGENSYDVLVGREFLKNQTFIETRKQSIDFAHGFDNLLIEGPFKLAVEYTLPKGEEFGRLTRRALRSNHILVVRQIWRGEVVGAVGVLLLPQRKQEKTSR